MLGNPSVLDMKSQLMELETSKNIMVGKPSVLDMKS
jgi:hypothetical protein